MTITSVAVDAIVASKTNPRRHFDKAAMADLTESVTKHGILQPVLVRPNGGAGSYELVAGERRFRAARSAGLEQIPVIVRELTDAEVLEVQVVENLQREDLHPLEEAEGYESLMKCQHADGRAYTAEEIAAKVGKSRSYVYARLKYTALCKEARELFFAGTLNESTALYVARIPVPSLQKKAAKEISEGYDGDPMSAREAAEHVRENYMLALKQAPFPTGDEKLLAGTTSCTACPKRTGNQTELFGDVQSADVCTDPACFDKKREAQATRLVAAAKAKGQAVIAGKEAKKLLPQTYSPLKGYVDLDAKRWDGKRETKIRALLGKDLPPVTLIQNPHTGEMIEAVKEADAAPLLKKSLPTTVARATAHSKTHIEAEKRRRGKEKLEAETRRAIYFAARDKAAAGLATEDVRLIAAAYWERHWHDWKKMIAPWWIPDKEPPDKKKPRLERDRIDAVTKKIATMDGQDLLRLLLDCALASNVANNGNAYLGGTGFKPIEAFAERHGVDHAAIRKDLAKTAQIDATTKAKAQKAKPPKASAKATGPEESRAEASS